MAISKQPANRRDAQALMDACRLGAYRPAHRTSDPQRQVRAMLTARDNLVRTRMRQIQVMRALLRREGLRVRSGQTSSIGQRVDEVAVPERLRAILRPGVGARRPARCHQRTRALQRQG